MRFLVGYLLVSFILEVKGFYAVTVDFPSNMYLIAVVSIYPLKEKYVFFMQTLKLL